MTRVLILGENGMLGDAVRKYLSERKDYELVHVSERWPSEAFRHAVTDTTADVIINCIGKIPQRHPTDEEYRETNIELPVFLDTLGKRVIYPTTDCEFSGTLPVGSLYTKDSLRDAKDVYGKSKATISERIERTFLNTKIILPALSGRLSRHPYICGGLRRRELKA